MGTPILLAPTNVRSIDAPDEHLWGSSGSNGANTLFTVGAGLPTTMASSAIPMGMAASTGPRPLLLPGPQSFPGRHDTLYVADDRAVAQGGVQRWELGTSGWSLTTTFNNTLTSGVRSITGSMRGTETVLLLTTGESPARILKYIDMGATTAAAPTVLAIAAAPMGSTQTHVFRGTALVPAPAP